MPAHFEQSNPANTRSGSRKILVALIASFAAAPSPASACCLTDWLYGRKAAYPIAQPVPVTSGQAVAPHSAGCAPYTAGYTPLLTPASNSQALPLASPSVASKSSYAVQRPAYGAVPLDNPSVYTGQPVASGYRGVATAGNSFYGTGNVYPNNYAAASPSVSTPAVTAYRADMGSSVALPVAPAYRTPIRSGLARFFDSLLGTGYRSSYYTAPITYYRPATTVDPVSAETVTVQQPCTSTVQQLQRTPYATLQPAPSVSSPLPSGTSCGVAPSGSLYGASPIPSTVPPNSPSSIGSYDPNSGYSQGNIAPTGGYSGGGDSQPLSPPTLPSGPTGPSPSYSDSAPTYSERPTYSDSTPSVPHANLSPLTGSPPSYRRELESDREPFPAPELRSARPAAPDSEDEAYRQGYQAGRAATRDEAQNQKRNDHQPYDEPKDSAPQSNRNSHREAEPSKEESYYQLDPPANQRPSTEESHQRSRFEIEQDQRDLRELTTGLPNPQGANRYVNQSSESEPRVRPIPAPENYHNPFQGNERLNAPDLLPSLPRPETQLHRGVDRSSAYRRQTEQQQRLSVPVREASIQGVQDRVPTRSSQRNQRRTATGTTARQAPSANAWQERLGEQSTDSGWYSKDAR